MITSIRKLVANIYVALTLCSLLLWFSSEQMQATPSSFSNSQYSGKAYFQAIFFAEGALAKKLPEIRDFNIRNFTNDSKTIQETLSFQQRVMNRIDQQHPSFFSTFKKAMASRNHKVISRQLAVGGQYLEEATLRITKVKRDAAAEAQIVEEITKNVSLERATPSEIQRAVKSHIDNFTSPQNTQGLIVHIQGGGIFLYIVLIVHDMRGVVWGPTNKLVNPDGDNDKTLKLSEEQLINSISKL